LYSPYQKYLGYTFYLTEIYLKNSQGSHGEVIREYYISTCRKDGGNPAAVAVIQTFGDYLSFNPHMHILAADGCFSDDGFFYAPSYSSTLCISCFSIMIFTLFESDNP